MAGVKAEFSKNALLQAGVLDYATDYDGVTFSEDDKATSITALEAYTYSSVGFYKELSIEHTLEDERSIDTDFCGAGNLYTGAALSSTMTFTWQEVMDLPVLAEFLGLTVETTVGVAEITGFKREQRELPSSLLRFTSCADEDGNSNTFYLVDAKISSSITMDMVNLTETDFEGSAVSFTVSKGGNFFVNKEIA